MCCPSILQQKQDVIDGVYFFIKEHISNETIGRDNHGKDARNKSMNIWQYYMAWAQENPLEYNVTNLLDVSKAASHDVIVASDHFFACIHECMEKSIEEKVIRDAPIAYLFNVAEKHLNVAVAFAKNNNMTGEALKKHIASSFDIYWNGIKA